MDRYKFRGKRIDNGEWIYGGLVQYGAVAEIHTAECRRVWRVSPESVGQFTGLHDVEGVEIYEGDRVDFTYWWFDGNHAESTLSGVIEYMSDCMSFGLTGIKNEDWLRHVGSDVDSQPFGEFLFDEADFKVIGTIHDQGGA